LGDRRAIAETEDFFEGHAAGSGVVSPKEIPKRAAFRAVRPKASLPMLWQASARQTLDHMATGRLGGGKS